MPQNSPLRALRAPKLLLAGCVATVALSGCGSAATTTTTVAADQLAANATPAQIYKASYAALASAKSYRMRATLTELTTPRTRMHMLLGIYSRNQLMATISTAGTSLTIILDGKRAYMLANRRFWLVHANGNVLAANAFGNRWLLTTPAQARKLAASARNLLSPAIRCQAEHGRLTGAGTTIVGQQDAVVVRDAGNYPGGQAGTMAVAMTGTPYPLQLIIRGARRPGGPTKGPCADSGQSWVGTMTFSDFNALGRLPVPVGAINLQALEHHKATPTFGSAD